MNDTPNPMFAKFDQILGAKSPTVSGTQVSSRADEVRSIAKSAVPQTQEPDMASRVSSDINNAGNEAYNAVKGEGQFSGDSSVARGISSVSSAFGAIPKVASEILPKPARDFLGKAGSQASDVISWLGDKIGSTQLAQDFVTKYPDAAKELEQYAKTGASAGNIAGTILASEGGARAVSKGSEIAPKIGEGIKNDVKEVSGKASDISSSKKLAKSAKAVQATEDTMTKSERTNAINEGRVKTTKLGGKEFTPSSTEMQAAEIMKGKLGSNPVKNLDIIKREISSRGMEAEKYLEENAKPVSAKEQFDIFDNLKNQASKYLTDSELKTYDEQIKMFSKQLVDKGGYDTSNMYKALKEYESNVADKLPRGKEALLDPTGIANAKIHAASDIRTAVRDLISSKHAEFKPKMFDLKSLYDAKDNILTKAEQLKGNKITRVIKRYPKLTGAAIGAAGVGGILR